MKKQIRFTQVAQAVIAGVLVLSGIGPLNAGEQAKQAAAARVADYVHSQKACRQVLTPEGAFVNVFNPQVAEWLRRKLDAALIREMRKALEPHLRIRLNRRGFAPAATRATEGKKDTTNYDAIWVRDNVWVYHCLRRQPARRDDAMKLLLALWDYYATDAQIQRFENVIANPSLRLDKMAMPHIRFDGNSADLGDVMQDGKPEEWNHRQIDAHGLFFAALGDAVLEGMITVKQATERRLHVLGLYPLFLARIDFTHYEDAGAWEEIPRRNTSSIGLVTRSLQVWRRVVHMGESQLHKRFRSRFLQQLTTSTAAVQGQWKADALDRLIAAGLDTVHRQLALGGESPAYAPEDVHFRRADCALAFLIQPAPLEGLSEADMRRILLIVETLRRPSGVLRYNHDSYQSGNYWIASPPAADTHAAGLTADTSSQSAYLDRLSRLMPETEAQWFFDSILAMDRLYLAGITEDTNLRRQDMHDAAVHLKRALGQLTGDTMTSDGQMAPPWQAPESINTVIVAGQAYYLPSPIVPLNWAKAGLSMALDVYAETLAGSDWKPPQGAAGP